MKTKCSYCEKEIDVPKYHFKKFKSRFCSRECFRKSLLKENKIVINKDCAEIHINDIIVLFDKEDIEKVSELKWLLCFDESIKNYYIQAHERNNYKNRRNIKLHRHIMNCPENMQVDHINRNTLDNRKCNLRICTLNENLNNKGEYKNNKSGHKNIYFSKTHNHWVFEYKKDKKIIKRKALKDLDELIQYKKEFLEQVSLI